MNGSDVYLLDDLPCHILGIILSSTEFTPRDAAFIACTNSRIRRSIKTAPLRLRLETQTSLSFTLNSLCKSFPGTAELDLSQIPLLDDLLHNILHSLPSLAALHLNGCKKITLKSVQDLIRIRPSIHSISLQRCFQLQHTALTLLLAASTHRLSKLLSLSLSHLDLSQWYFHRTSPSSTLKILALHNCTKLTLHGLHAITAQCTLLRALCLGGCTLDLIDHEPSINASTTTSCDDGAMGPRSIPGSTTIPNASNSDSNESSGDDASSQRSSLLALDFFLFNDNDDRALQGHALGTIDDTIRNNTRNSNDMCFMKTSRQRHSVQYTSTYASDPDHAWAQSTACAMYNVIKNLRFLHVLELSFCPPKVLSFLKFMLHPAAHSAAQMCDQTRSPATTISRALNNANCSTAAIPCAERMTYSTHSRMIPHVWDFCNPMDVHHATIWRDHAVHAGILPAHHVDAMLRASSRCSSGGRTTPVHIAAETGNLHHAEELLSLGAHVTSRDRSGAAPLFTACEAGHADVVSLLLQAGADPTARNAAGEAPLYIASLRGHARVVDVLVSHCTHRAIQWQDPSLYGDGWTPLHAAAVSGRLAIAVQILDAAARHSPDATARLVRATNRYGQTSLHVAARKGTPALLQVLMRAGDKRALALLDCDGKTAADVARRNGNAAVWKMLTLGLHTFEGRDRCLQPGAYDAVHFKRSALTKKHGHAKDPPNKHIDRSSSVQSSSSSTSASDDDTLAERAGPLLLQAKEGMECIRTTSKWVGRRLQQRRMLDDSRT